MKENKLPLPARKALAVLWRAALIIAVVCLMAVVGAYMILNTIFNGPSESARNTVTMTMLEYPKTAGIPSMFLDEAVLDEITGAADTLSGECSDPSLVHVNNQVTQGEAYFIREENYTARVTLVRDLSQLHLSDTDGSNYAGFNSDGVLIVAVDADAAAAQGITGHCGKILIMDGQVNEGLFTSPCGYAARTAIGQCADGTVIIISMDGGTREYIGGTWQDLINIMTEYGAVNACCLSASAFASEE